MRTDGQRCIFASRDHSVSNAEYCFLTKGNQPCSVEINQVLGDRSVEFIVCDV